MLFNATGGTAVQVVSGSVTTSRTGTATVDCGFRPDLVVFYVSQFTSDGSLYENVLCLPIAESKTQNGAGLNNLTWESSTFENIIEVWPDSITDTGVNVTFYRYASGSAAAVSRKTYQWTAVKYTA